MSIWYCRPCNKAFLERQVVKIPGYTYCQKCYALLHCFGEEDSQLSEDEVFDAYDQEHPFDPIGEFQDRAKDFPNTKPDINVAECEEMLRVNPNHETALLHLGLFYQSQRNFVMADSYFERLLESNPSHQFGLERRIDILMSLENYKLAIHHIRILNGLVGDNSVILFNVGVACYFTRHSTMALKAFKKALTYSSDKEFSQKIRDIIKQIS